MSSYETDAMLETLSLKLRDAEVRRAEAERAHQVNDTIFHPKLIHFLFWVEPIAILSFIFHRNRKSVMIGVSFISSK